MVPRGLVPLEEPRETSTTAEVSWKRKVSCQVPRGVQGVSETQAEVPGSAVETAPESREHSVPEVEQTASVFRPGRMVGENRSNSHVQNRMSGLPCRGCARSTLV